MDRARFSFIAHTEHDICNPIGKEPTERAMDALAACCGLKAGDRIVDIGAGKGEWPLRLAEKFGVKAVALEPAPLFAAEIAKRARGRVPGGTIEVVQKKAQEYFEPGMKFDGALCVGASHAFGDLRKVLEAVRGIVKPGGGIVIGEGYWRKPPEPKYLASFGGSEEELTTHEGNLALMAEMGLTPVFNCVASEEEFADYERKYSHGIENFVAQNRDDPEAPKMLDRSRRWHAAFLRWGKTTMGFGVYVMANQK